MACTSIPGSQDAEARTQTWKCSTRRRVQQLLTPSRYWVHDDSALPFVASLRPRLQGDGLRAARSRARRSSFEASGSFAFSHRPITPFMGPSKEGTRILHSVRPSTNMSKDMCALNRPNLNWRNGLTRIPGCPPSPGGSSPSPTPSASSKSSTETLLTRRDIERLFGVSTARAATLMQTFGAEMTGCQRTLPRTKLLRQLRKHRARSAFRGEVERRDRLVAELRKARLTGIRVTLPAETLDAKLASLPEGVSVSRDRIEVRCSGAKEAVERLYALAYALVNDYERFEQLVDGGEAGNRGEVSE